jgi:hypothetical protein
LRKAKDELADEPLASIDLSAALRDLINKLRGPGAAPVSECLVAADDPRYSMGLVLRREPREAANPFRLPVGYMVGFWRRRDLEGTTHLAISALDVLLAALKDDQRVP